MSVKDGYNGHNVSTEEMFEQALNENYYLLDMTGIGGNLSCNKTHTKY